MTAEHVDRLEKKISRLIKKANKKKKKAKKTKVKRYFEGQNDAFEKILSELKNLKYELETSEEQEQELLEEEGENLLKKALEKGVILRKTSFYLHDDFPNGKVHGKKKVLQAIMESHLQKKIQNQIATAEDIIHQ